MITIPYFPVGELSGQHVHGCVNKTRWNEMSGLLGSALAQDDGYRLQVLGGFLRFFSTPCRLMIEADKTGLSFFEPFVHGMA